MIMTDDLRKKFEKNIIVEIIDDEEDKKDKKRR